MSNLRHLLLGAVVLAGVAGDVRAERPPLPTSGVPPTVAAEPFGGPGTGRKLQGLCVDDFARAPVIEAGREADVVGLFAPHRTDAPLEGHPGWTFKGISVAKQRLEAKLSGPDGASSTLSVQWHGCAEPDAILSKSFAVRIKGAQAPAKTLATQVVRNDSGGFFRAFAMPSGYRAIPRRTPVDGGGEEASVGEEEDGIVLSRHLNGIIVVLLLCCLLAWLVEFPFLFKELRLIGAPGARQTWILLFVIMLAGLLVRHMAGSTFIREAYPFPNVAWQLEEVKNVFMSRLDAYPKGPEAMMHWLGPWMADDPYDAWFLARLHFGALTIFWVFITGIALFKRRAAGLAFALTLAFLPHHVRLSASESTHADFIFFGSAAVALLILAARNGRFTTFLAGALAAVGAALMRPEAPLIVVGLGILALAAGPRIREKWKHPLYVGVVVILVWAVLPQMLHILGDESTKSFAPSSDNEGINFSAVGRALLAMVDPTGNNALFDWQISPLWIYPSVLFGCWALWKRQQRGVAAGLAGIVGTYLIIYSGLPPSVTIWKMGRYHGALLIGAVPLAAAGIWIVSERLRQLDAPVKRVAASGALAVVGLGIWWPAIAALPMDWQRDAHFIIELGREHAVRLQADGVRIILPDNRRRFIDQAPRTAIVPLTQQKRSIENAVTIAHALEHYRAPGKRNVPAAYYYEGLFCYMARDPGLGEAMNPQCEAMRKTFDLEPVDALEVGPEVYLNMYLDARPSGNLTFRLYTVGNRRLSPKEALKLIPEPLGKRARQNQHITGPYGFATGQSLFPVVPPL